MNSVEIKKGGFSGLLENNYITMPDGARWRHFEIPDGVVILTSSGNELFKGSNIKDIFADMRVYRDDIANRRQSGGTRRYLANGGNGEVYTIGDHMLVVKESMSSQSLYSALHRMDSLSRVVESHLPHWVSVAIHYGLITSRNLDREYLLIEKIDGGVSLEDLVQYVERGSARSSSLTDSVRKNFPYISKKDIDSLKNQFKEFKDILRNYTLSSEAYEYGHTFESLMPDPNYANILVEKLETPIGGKYYKFYIVDQ